MLSQYTNINSQLDALRMKDIEKIFYKNMDKDVKVIPKVTPFKGISTDMLYIKDDRILFLKFMDTTEDLFLILEEELLEVMNEEYELLRLKMSQNNKNISYNYVFVMPYVEIGDKYGFDDFVDKNIIDRKTLKDIIEDYTLIDKYLREENNEIELNLFLLSICSEYYLFNNRLHLEKDFKKISYLNDDYSYTATMLEKSQIKDVLSINYGNTLFNGGSATGKTTIMLSRAIKLSKIYPHHKFLVFTHTKQLCNELREHIKLLYKENNNLEIHTFSSFVFKLARKYNLVVDYNMLKNDYEKAFANILKQADNVIKTKNMFKGIFIDEAESFLDYEIEFIREFLYKTKFVFNIYSCHALDISNNLNIFKPLFKEIEFDEIITLDKNYRQSEGLVEFINRFASNSNKYIKNLRPVINNDVFLKTRSIREGTNVVNMIKVSDLEDQISSVIWELRYLMNEKGIDSSEIAIVYPYNKKRLKSGKTIYFQYMLRKALDEANIAYICAEENLTNISKKTGTTISNIYTIKNLEYKAVIVCELEMLYNHTINNKEQDYQVNDFVGDLNKVYLAINRATDYLSIITTFNEDASDIIRILKESK